MTDRNAKKEFHVNETLLLGGFRSRWLRIRGENPVIKYGGSNMVDRNTKKYDLNGTRYSEFFFIILDE